MPTFAAIDIGSNSCRLAIASVQAHKLKTLHEDREVTRLGQSVFRTGRVSQEATDLVCGVLARRAQPRLQLCYGDLIGRHLPPRGECLQECCSRHFEE